MSTSTIEESGGQAQANIRKWKGPMASPISDWGSGQTEEKKKFHS